MSCVSLVVRENSQFARTTVPVERTVPLAVMAVQLTNAGHFYRCFEKQALEFRCELMGHNHLDALDCRTDAEYRYNYCKVFSCQNAADTMVSLFSNFLNDSLFSHVKRNVSSFTTRTFNTVHALHTVQTVVPATSTCVSRELRPLRSQK